jgi:formate hydrogenlyase subunit 4
VDETLRTFVGTLFQVAGLLAAAPLLRGGIKKMKATMQMRKGPRLLQGYYDLAKLFQKETVRSETASWVYVLGPRLYFASAVAAATLVPVAVAASPLDGAGGILGLVGILALGRFALAAAALDTGSPFGGMGSSREMTIAALAEPALMLGLFTSALAAGSLDLGAIVRGMLERGGLLRPSDILALSGLFVVLIAETGRIPVDNPATHLELTMIHEAMALEYAGPDLALVEWAAALKELLYITLLIDLFLPLGMASLVGAVPLAIGTAAWAAKVSAFGLVITLVETTNAKLRLFRVPELVAVSLGLGFIALAIRFL